jgi:toxin ParE1/3/4
MKYRISESAYQDLNDIWFYTFSEWSEIKADKYFNSIIQEIELFSEKPEKAKPLKNFKSKYYYFRVLSHYVFFKFENGQIDVIRILHKMMDFPKHLE